VKYLTWFRFTRSADRLPHHEVETERKGGKETKRWTPTAELTLKRSIELGHKRWQREFVWQLRLARWLGWMPLSCVYSCRERTLRPRQLRRQTDRSLTHVLLHLSDNDEDMSPSNDAQRSTRPDIERTNSGRAPSTLGLEAHSLLDEFLYEIWQSYKKINKGELSEELAVRRKWSKSIR